MKLFTAQTTNANGTAVRWPGGTGSFYAWGTFGAGTVKLEASPDNGTTFIAVGTDTNLTANGIGNFTLGPCSIRASLSGATGPNVNAEAIPCAEKVERA